MRLLRVAPQQIDQVWDTVRPHIQDALDKTGMGFLTDAEHIKTAICKDGLHCWVVVEDNENIIASIVTRVMHHPKSSTFEVMLLGGERLDEWVNDTWACLKQIAKDAYGCKSIWGFGRNGWARKLDDDIHRSAMWYVMLED